MISGSLDFPGVALGPYGPVAFHLKTRFNVRCLRGCPQSDLQINYLQYNVSGDVQHAAPVANLNSCKTKNTPQGWFTSLNKMYTFTFINNSWITISPVCLSGYLYVAVMLNHVEEYQFTLLTFLIQEHVYTFAFNALADMRLREACPHFSCRILGIWQMKLEGEPGVPEPIYLRFSSMSLQVFQSSPHATAPLPICLLSPSILSPIRLDKSLTQLLQLEKQKWKTKYWLLFK